MQVSNITFGVVLVSLFAGVAVAGFLFALMMFSDERQARVERRVRQYLIRKARRGPSQALAREQQRAALFAELDRRWQGRSFFKSLQADVESAALEMSVTELLLIQVGVGLLLSLPLWVLLHAWGLLLTPLALVVGAFIVRSVV